MRILVINSEYPPIGGGAGNASAHIARSLAVQGHQITVVTSRFANLPQMEQQSGVTIYRIPALRRRQDRSGALEQIIFILSASFQTPRLVRHIKPNATLAFFGVPSGAVAYFIKTICNIPYIVSLRGGDVPGFRPYDFGTYHKLIAPLLRIIWKNAFAIVANSNGLRDLALKFNARFEIPVIPNGVDLDLYKTDARDWTVPRILSVGRIVHQKGLDLALRALADLKDSKWEWRLAGDGPQIDPLKSLASELGIADRVTFLGWQSREQLLEQYKHSNLFLFPSRHEGMPNAVLEAMASGLPVIASRIAGNEELVLNEETGILFESEDTNALSDALNKLLINASLRQKMGAASRLRVEEHYSWESTAKQYALLLEQVQ
ncbi:MAG: glycosyltransferase family 4 protein [Chloroflexota bacterium]